MLLGILYATSKNCFYYSERKNVNINMHLFSYAVVGCCNICIGAKMQTINFKNTLCVCVRRKVALGCLFVVGERIHPAEKTNGENPFFSSILLPRYILA